MVLTCFNRCVVFQRIMISIISPRFSMLTVGKLKPALQNFVLADGVLTATLRKSFQCREGKVTTKNPTLLQGLQGRDPPTPSVKSSICSFDMVTNLEHREMRTGEPIMNLKT